MSERDVVLEVEDLKVEFDTYGGIVHAVRGVSFQVRQGETLAIVGESGCGKSVTMQSIMGLIPMPPGRITSGTAMYRGQDLIRNKYLGGRDIRGSAIGMVFQDPMTSLNPTMTMPHGLVTHAPGDSAHVCVALVHMPLASVNSPLQLAVGGKSWTRAAYGHTVTIMRTLVDVEPHE